MCDREKNYIGKNALDSLSIAGLTSDALISSHFGLAASKAAEVCLHARVSLLLALFLWHATDLPEVVIAYQVPLQSSTIRHLPLPRIPHIVATGHLKLALVTTEWAFFYPIR